MINLQPSLIIWTVICFSLFALILNKLIFGPILALMDKRSERLSAAKAHSEELKSAREAAKLERAALEREAIRLASEEAKRLEHEAVKTAAAQVAEYSAASAAQIERELARAEAKRDSLRVTMNEGVTALAADFAAVYTNTTEEVQ